MCVKSVFVCSGPVKLPGGGSYSQFDVLGGGWHRSAAVKMDTPPANPTWPPGNIQISFLLVTSVFVHSESPNLIFRHFYTTV